MKFLKVFKKVVFWFFIVITVLLIISVLATISDEPDKETSIIIIMVLLFPWLIYIMVKLIIYDILRSKTRAEKYRKAVEEKNNELEEKFAGYKLIAEYQKHMLYVNEEKKQFALGDNFYNFQDLISAEIVADDDVITTTYTKNKVSVSKALVGGALFGGVGAIIGGNAGKPKSTSINKQVCDKLQIKLTLNSFETPIIYIDFIKGRTKKSGFLTTYQKAFEKAEQFLGIFQVIINNKI